MSEAHSTFSLLEKLSRGQAEKRTYIDLLFSGFSSSVSDGLLSLIRSSGLSPRGRVVRSEAELLEALSDRNWNLVFCADSDKSQLHPLDITRLLQTESRDLPVIQLSDSPTYDDQQVAINSGIAFLLPISAQQLIVTRTSQLLEQQRMKRRLHQLEIGMEQISKLNHRYAEESNLAIASIVEGKLTEANNSFVELFRLKGNNDHHLTLQQLLPGESLREINEQLKSPTSSFSDTLMMRDSTGAEFSALVQLFPATPDKPNTRPIVIDSLALTSKITPAEAEAHQLMSEEELLIQIERQLHQAMTGGHDAYLLYFRVDPIPVTSDPQLIEQLQHSMNHCLHSMKSEHTLARLKHLDIAALVEGFDRSLAKSAAQQVQACLNDKRLVLPAGVSSLALSVGITAINDSSPSPSEVLLRAAQSARPLSDQFNPQAAFTNPVQHQMEIDSATKALENAIANQQLKLLYQPLVSLGESAKECIYEVLVRLQDGDSHDRLPAQFLASLEHARVMVKLDRWVIERTLQVLQERHPAPSDVQVFINLARRTIKSSSFSVWMITLLTELRLAGERITLEMSESDVAADLESAVSLCKEVRKVGVRICVKHFGCSTSSTKVYSRLKPETIKLDGAFIEELSNPDRGPKAIGKLLAPIDKSITRVVAPLIEDAHTLPELYRMGIDMVQGYYIQPPQEEMSYEYFERIEA